ncbi:MAG: FHA domain-containing protein [Planctomycetota bacterium]
MSKLRLKLDVPGAPPLETEVESGATIGRSRSCHVRVNDEKTSGKHCRLDFASGQWTVTDLGSSNHTKVDGVELAKNESRPLSDGTRFQVGRAWVEVSIVTNDLSSSATIPESMPKSGSIDGEGTDFGERTIPQAAPVPAPDSDATMPSGPPAKRDESPESELTIAQGVEDATLPLPSNPAGASEPPAPVPSAATPASHAAPPLPKGSTPPSAGGQTTLDAEPDEFKSVAVGVAISQGRPRLWIVRPGKVECIEVSRSPFVVGRGEEVEPPGRIDHPAISNQHCQLIFRDHRWLLVSYKDNTTIDGVPAPKDEPRLLESETLIHLGSLPAMFVVGSSAGGDSGLYPLALRVLENRKSITKEQRKQAASDATEEKHPGEHLIENEVVSADAWADAFKAAKLLRDSGASGAGALHPGIWIAIGAGGLLLLFGLLQLF